MCNDQDVTVIFKNDGSISVIPNREIEGRYVYSIYAAKIAYENACERLEKWKASLSKPE